MARPRITMQKWNGNDPRSWAVMVDGRVADVLLTGLTRDQARYYKRQIETQLLKRSKGDS